MSQNIVFYHAQCMDGTAAAAAHMKAFNQDGIKVEYHPINYSHIKNLNEFEQFVYNIATRYRGLDSWLLPNVTVWFLDFTPTEEILLHLSKTQERVIIIDHHATGVDMLNKLMKPFNEEEGVIQMPKNVFFITGASDEFSGAYLTDIFRNQFHLLLDGESVNYTRRVFHRLQGKIYDSEIYTNVLDLKNPNIPYSNLYELIRIRDTWDKRNPELKTKADALNYACFHDGIPDNPEVFNEKVTSDTLDSLTLKGKTIQEVHQRYCQNAIDSGYKISLDSETMDNINLLVTVCPANQASLLGEMWYSKFPDEPAICVGLFYNHSKATVGFGMRSNEFINCRMIAEALGGGGHDRAAGGSLTDKVLIEQYSGNMLAKDFLQSIRELIENTIFEVY